MIRNIAKTYDLVHGLILVFVACIFLKIIVARTVEQIKLVYTFRNVTKNY